ncbi:unnamed protein product [Macrosiphum euphorbiae]|uniref:Uncharacterized protein n=1 Tax=Macrosiphum euphorbiae TaxID=13131 RepID=A0AAV0W2N6_9HEMI|nr:unnamed protein product [Macrosiphum euphorbiae]
MMCTYLCHSFDSIGELHMSVIGWIEWYTISVARHVPILMADAINMNLRPKNSTSSTVVRHSRTCGKPGGRVIVTD